MPIHKDIIRICATLNLEHEYDAGRNYTVIAFIYMAC